MDYVVLDLEWNQASDSRDARNRLLTFEIIEIGAVKLNSRMEIVDTFEELIRPQVYDTMHHITEKLIGIHMKDLSGCRTFDVVMKDFLAWCGEDFMFGTWGPPGSDGASEKYAVFRYGAPWKRTCPVL